MRKLVILGSGGYGQTVADIAEQSGVYSRILLLDDAGENKCDSFTRYIDSSTEFYPAFGNNELRIKWLRQIEKSGGFIATIIHNRAYVSPTAKIAKGVVIMPMAVVNTNCILECGVIVNIGAIIDHGCVIEEGVHLAPSSTVKAENRIKKFRKIETGVVIQNREYPV